MEQIAVKCKSSGIKYKIEDQREKGRPIQVGFQGELRIQQDLAT
ncbi:hypothetical protein [Mediterraneibacter gnavus]